MFIMFASWLSYINTYRSARKLLENKTVFEKLGKWPEITQMIVLILTIIYALFGLVLFYINKNYIIEYVVAGFSIFIMILYLFKASIYWKLIIEK